MNSNAKRMVLLLCVLALQACGAAHINQSQKSNDIGDYDNAYVEVSVQSVEQNGDALETNEQMKKYATESLEALVERTHTLLPSAAEQASSLAFRIDLKIKYGSRAARYWGGFGAGKGYVNSIFTITDEKTGELKYRSSGASDLSVGAFGGSMQAVIKKNVDALIKGYSGG